MNSNWKIECNYWHKTNESGRTINIIKVDGIEVEVSDAVYAVYAGIGRKERYARERASKRQLSLERAEEDGLPLFMLAVGIFSPSAESDYIESISEEEQCRQHMLLSEALASLAPDELTLIRCLFISTSVRSSREAGGTKNHPLCGCATEVIPQKTPF